MMDDDLGYDEGALVNDLRAWWNDQVGGDDPFVSPKAPSGTIFDVVPEMDSLSAVTGLVTVEEHLGFDVPPTMIRRGGYSNFDDMVNDIMPKVRSMAEKHKAANGKLKKKEAA